MKKGILGIVIAVIAALAFLYLAFGRDTGNNYMEDLRQLSQVWHSESISL